MPIDDAHWNAQGRRIGAQEGGLYRAGALTRAQARVAVFAALADALAALDPGERDAALDAAAQGYLAADPDRTRR